MVVQRRSLSRKKKSKVSLNRTTTLLAVKRVDTTIGSVLKRQVAASGYIQSMLPDNSLLICIAVVTGIDLLQMIPDIAQISGTMYTKPPYLCEYQNQNNHYPNVHCLNLLPELNNT